MTIKMIALCSIACLSLNVINASDQPAEKKRVFEELSTAAAYGGAITALGAIPVAATSLLLGNRDNGLLNIEQTTASTAALAVLASVGAYVSLECLLRKPGGKKTVTKTAQTCLERATLVSLGMATAYAASKLTNNTVSPSTFISSFFTGIGIITAFSIHTQSIRPRRTT